MFKNFEIEDSVVFFDILLYDPNYIIPLKNSFKISINFPPIIGKTQIFPVSGDSLCTIFEIKVMDFKDSNGDN